MAYRHRRPFRRYRRRYPRWKGRRVHRRHTWRPFHHWRRWRRRPYRRGTVAVRYTNPRRHKYISVTGWEPLGNCCIQDKASDEATPYEDLDSDVQTWANRTRTAGIWHGTYGHHYPWQLLCQRAQFYFCTFSSGWKGYDYLQFYGGNIWLPKLAAPYFFWVDPTVQDPKKSSYESLCEGQDLVPPRGIHEQKGAHYIPANNESHTLKGYKRIHIKRLSTWEGVYAISTAADYILVHWVWSTVTKNWAFFDGACYQAGQASSDTCNSTPWFMSAQTAESGVKKEVDEYKKTNDFKNNLYCYPDPRASWVNRQKYNKTIQPLTVTENPGGPFLPSQGAGLGLSRQYDQVSFWFRYRFKFKVSGDSVYRRLPAVSNTDTIPEAPGAQNQVSPRSILKARPLDTGDILEGDLQDGCLTEESLRRITGSHRRRLPTKLADSSSRRVRLFHDPGVRKRRIRRLLSGLLE
ncbi:ORF1 [Seal anellovirus 6]|uniref:ORF1 n=1 Tax=Seal anellovirus 6 TaxID=1566012 RepID=A0A0A7TWN7_9VIRU|nr:ORF1 [Seal anellovirus 6]